jgi:hypothetical protein
LRAEYVHPYAIRPAPTIRILIGITFLEFLMHQRGMRECNNRNMYTTLV